MKIARWTIGLALVATLGAACGGGGETGGETGEETEGGGAPGEVNMVDNAFQPSTITAEAGSSLTVMNTGQAPHTFTVEGGEIDEEVEPGAETQVTIDLEAGEYPVVCEFHPEMTGTLTVQ